MRQKLAFAMLIAADAAGVLWGMPSSVAACVRPAMKGDVRARRKLTVAAGILISAVVAGRCLSSARHIWAAAAAPGSALRAIAALHAIGIGLAGIPPGLLWLYLSFRLVALGGDNDAEDGAAMLFCSGLLIAGLAIFA